MVKEYLNYYKGELKKCINDLKHKDTFYKQIPNLLTFSRAIGMIPVNILLFNGNSLLAMILLGMLLTTDFFDGKIARKYNIVSKFGADLDAICDKIMVLGLIIPLLVNTPELAVVLLFEGLITGVNVLGRIKGLDTRTVYSGKVKTWFLSITLGLGYFLKLFNFSNKLLLCSSFVTVISQGLTLNDYIVQYNKMKRQLELNKNIDDVGVIEINNDVNKIDELRKEREFYLGMLEPGKVYSGKKRTRKLVQEKRNCF